jgi:predicted methyltransferase
MCGPAFVLSSVLNALAPGEDSPLLNLSKRSPIRASVGSLLLLLTAVLALGPAGSSAQPPVADRIAAVLAGQSEEVRARYAARHPAETLAFFGIEPGMAVLEADPGSGWYTRILLELLGPRGRLVGADYPMAVYRLFDYYSEEELAAKESWADTWPEIVAAGVDGAAAVEAYSLDALPGSLDGSLDAVLFIRVLHNLADFEAEGAFYSRAVAEAYRVLKPGGVVGVVQHMAPEGHSDEWASGANGYLKQSFVIRSFEAAGFRLEGTSAINENPLDKPSEAESVWRLPPTSEVDDEALAAAYAAIGESTRMTLRFRKPEM